MKTYSRPLTAVSLIHLSLTTFKLSKRPSPQEFGRRRAVPGGERMSPIGMMVCAVILLASLRGSAFAGSVDVQKTTYSKATIQFTKPSFSVKLWSNRRDFRKGNACAPSF
ncbi:MAG: hypothetical protein HY925_00950 [Elusimicrobia bacterium]|nr:hypothetical protein [Elusimicrobiota bacterium]